MAVYGYVRVSTDRAGRRWREPRRPEAHHRRLCNKGWAHPPPSGSSPLGERPKGGRLMVVLRAEDVVITPKPDRMFRPALSALDVLGPLKERGVVLHIIDLGGDATENRISKLVSMIFRPFVMSCSASRRPHDASFFERVVRRTCVLNSTICVFERLICQGIPLVIWWPDNRPL